MRFAIPLLVLLAGALLIAQGPKPAVAPVQPIPYSHALHAGKLKLKCSMCHENKDPGETMGIPTADKCMTCHQAVKTDSDAIQKLKSYADSKKEVPWVRVYQIPGYVFFSHRAHTEAGATCQECHGEAASAEILKRESDISMGGCMTCHRQKKAPLNCSYCHELQN